REQAHAPALPPPPPRPSADPQASASRSQPPSIHRPPASSSGAFATAQIARPPAGSAAMPSPHKARDHRKQAMNNESQAPMEPCGLSHPPVSPSSRNSVPREQPRNSAPDARPNRRKPPSAWSSAISSV